MPSPLPHAVLMQSDDDLMDPWSALGIEKTQQKLSFINDVQSAVAEIESRLVNQSAQNPPVADDYQAARVNFLNTPLPFSALQNYNTYRSAPAHSDVAAHSKTAAHSTTTTNSFQSVTHAEVSVPPVAYYVKQFETSPVHHATAGQKEPVNPTPIAPIVERFETVPEHSRSESPRGAPLAAIVQQHEMPPATQPNSSPLQSCKLTTLNISSASLQNHEIQSNNIRPNKEPVVESPVDIINYHLQPAVPDIQTGDVSYRHRKAVVTKSRAPKPSSVEADADSGVGDEIICYPTPTGIAADTTVERRESCLASMVHANGYLHTALISEYEPVRSSKEKGKSLSTSGTPGSENDPVLSAAQELVDEIFERIGRSEGPVKKTMPPAGDEVLNEAVALMTQFPTDQKELLGVDTATWKEIIPSKEGIRSEKSVDSRIEQIVISSLPHKKETKSSSVSDDKAVEPTAIISHDTVVAPTNPVVPLHRISTRIPQPKTLTRQNISASKNSVSIPSKTPENKLSVPEKKTQRHARQEKKQDGSTASLPHFKSVIPTATERNTPGKEALKTERALAKLGRGTASAAETFRRRRSVATKARLAQSRLNKLQEDASSASSAETNGSNVTALDNGNEPSPNTPKIVKQQSTARSNASSRLRDRTTAPLGRTMKHSPFTSRKNPIIASPTGHAQERKSSGLSSEIPALPRRGSNQRTQTRLYNSSRDSSPAPHPPQSPRTSRTQTVIPPSVRRSRGSVGSASSKGGHDSDTPSSPTQRSRGSLPRVALLGPKNVTTPAHRTRRASSALAKSNVPRGATFAGNVPRTRSSLSGTPGARKQVTPSSPVTPLVKGGNYSDSGDLRRTFSFQTRRSPSTAASRKQVTASSPVTPVKPLVGVGNNSDPDSVQKTLSFSPPRRSGATSTNKPRLPLDGVSTKPEVQTPPPRTSPRRSSLSSSPSTSRLSQGVRPRVTIPEPFALSGDRLQKKREKHLEESRRHAAAVETRRHTFQARPMPDFSKPFPRPFA